MPVEDIDIDKLMKEQAKDLAEIQALQKQITALGEDLTPEDEQLVQKELDSAFKQERAKKNWQKLAKADIFKFKPKLVGKGKRLAQKREEQLNGIEDEIQKFRQQIIENGGRDPLAPGNEIVEDNRNLLVRAGAFCGRTVAEEQDKMCIIF